MNVNSRKYIKLIDLLTQVAPALHTLHLQLYDTDEAVVDSFTDSSGEMLQHQR